MVDEIQVSLEWAYWIHMKTYKMYRVRETVPVGSVVLSKSKDSDGTRSFISTQYHVAESGGLVSRTKKEINHYIVQHAVEYMREKSMWPPDMRVAKAYKNGSVDVSYQPSEYDGFVLTVDPKLIGDDVEGFLNGLGEHKSLEPDSLLPRVEPAKSSRSTCRGCGRNIGKETIRVGEPAVFQEHVSYGWYHLQCASKLLRGRSPEQLEGFEALSDEQQTLLRQALRSEQPGGP